MIKVLHSVLSLETGGLENGVVNLVNSAPPDIQVDVLCLRARGELAERITHPHAKIILSPYIQTNDYSIKASVLAHKQCLKNNSYDILHTHGWSTMLSGAIASYWHRYGFIRSRPLIVNGEHGVFYADHWRRRLMQKILFQSIDANLAVSADLGLRMEQAFGLKAKTFHPILNGVQLDKFNQNPLNGKALRNSIGCSPEDLIIGSVGRLVAIKNYPLLIKAFAQLYQTSPQLYLVLCGDGEARPMLEDLVDELGIAQRVHFTGRVDNVSEWMQVFDIFALSSFMEGLPNTLLEAMASGVPAIVTDVGGSREVMPPNGGVLVPSDDLPAYINGLNVLVNSSQNRDSVSKIARQYVESELSIHAMAENYYNFYRGLLS